VVLWRQRKKPGAFAKKQDKLPQNEKIKALNYKIGYETRVKKGSYYA